MEPIGGTFLTLVCGLAAGCLLAVVLLWPRAAGPGARPLLARSGMLLAAQATLTAAIIVLTNRYFVFYATWDDLLGADTVKVRVNQVQPSRGQEADPAALVRRTTTDLGPRRRGHERDPRRDGRVDRLEIRGARSGLDGEAYVYLPPQYFQPAYAKKRLPVVIVVSGGPSDGKTAWIKQARLPEAVNAMARVQPVVYAMVRSARGLVPAPRPPAGAGADKGLPRAGAPDARPTACLDLPGRSGGQAETYFAQDLPLALAGAYQLARSRNGWGAAGYATGGQCAARLAMLHSDRFSAAAVLDGQFGLPTGGGVVGEQNNPQVHGPNDDPYGGSDAYRRDNDLLWRMEYLAPPPVSILAAAGGDGPSAPQAARFAALARRPMWAAKSLVPGAPQTLKQWQPHLTPVLEWLGTHLRGE
ncbi:alpha/beta hydrolase [Actinomadura rubrisoli]|uniref:Esterase n=1 Tax=Actinomadura rubrisoli TaxID=2530368 RepID=A0A4R5A4I8_9ACTN|nr:hypothetical protein [Actinomadura rubrisoli]TDD65826.1 hypothetical protein E1298_41010 [Actinomadura rubrisoli]